MNITTPDWVQDAVFYQIFSDRFARSSRNPAGKLPFESWDSAPTVHGYKGGDLYGVAEKLDYLKDLGITALYLNPIFASASNHRYHAYDYYAVDPLLGGNEAFQELLNEAHKRDIRVVLDGVFNHASVQGAWVQGFLEGERRYQDYFIEVRGNPDLSKVVRPRAVPLLTNFNTLSGEKRVWTTFSADQIDMNFKNAKVLLEILDILFMYVERGADFIRLDAIA